MLDQVIKEENAAILNKCVSQLPKKFQTAILMKYYYNRSDSDISKVIGVSVASVRMILTRARSKLKKTYIQLIGEEAAE